MINVFVADDHTMFREMLKDTLTQDSEIAIKDEAQNGEEALQKLLKSHFDVVVLDIAMPGLNGLEVLKRLRDVKPDARVLMLSMYSEEQYAVRAFRAGACGYITKSEATQELLTAIRKIASGGKYISSQAAEQLLFQLTNAPEGPLHEKLSKREHQIMLMIASGKSTGDISKELGLKPSTVSTLRARILKKMNMKNNSELTHYVIKEDLLN